MGWQQPTRASREGCVCFLVKDDRYAVCVVLVKTNMTLPSVFAVIVVHDNHTGSALVYESVRVVSSSRPSGGDDRLYRIVPRSFYQQDVTPTFTMANRPTGRAWPEITLTVGSGDVVLYNGEWWATGTSVYTVYHPLPIPALGFSDGLMRGAWPQTDNCLELMRGNPWSLQFWERRWNPAVIYEDLQPRHAATVLSQRPPRDSVGAGVGGSRPLVTGNTVNEQTVASNAVTTMVQPRQQTVAPPVASLPQPRQQTVSPPKFVTDLIVADAVGRGATCPITMEPLTVESARVTPCFHVFDATALAAWLAAGNESCPVCKGGLAGRD